MSASVTTTQLEIHTPLPRYAPLFRHQGIPPHPELVLGCPYLFNDGPWEDSSNSKNQSYLLPPIVNVPEQFAPSSSVIPRHTFASLTLPQSIPSSTHSSSSSPEDPPFAPHRARKRMRLSSNIGSVQNYSLQADSRSAVQHDHWSTPLPAAPTGRNAMPSTGSWGPQMSIFENDETPKFFYNETLPPPHQPVLTRNGVVGNVRHPPSGSKQTPGISMIHSPTEPFFPIIIPPIARSLNLGQSKASFPPSFSPWSTSGLKRRYDDIGRVAAH